MPRWLPLIAVGLAGIAAPLWGQVQVWRAGEGGVDWASQSEISAGIDLRRPDFIQPSGFTPEDNIAATLTWQDETPVDFIREGQARVWDNAAVKASNLVMVDGDRASSTGGRFKEPNVNQTGRIFFFDLGASFPAERIVFYPSPQEGADFVRAFEISLSDGRSFSREGQPIYEVVKRVETTPDPRVDIRFPRQLLRFIKLRILAPNPFEIAEFEVYGEGFVPTAQYLSKLIDFGQPVNFGALRVKAERLGETVRTDGPTAAVVLAVRNGADETPLVYYRLDLETQSEIKVSAEEYKGLSSVEKGPVRLDRANWSAWSNPLEMVESDTFELAMDFLPGPRRYFQLDLSFVGSSTEVMRVRSLEITHSAPLAHRGWAEVALRDQPTPPEGVASAVTGRAVPLIYGVRAEFGEGEFAGFDGVHIETPTPPAFIGLKMGESQGEVAPDSVRQDSTGLWVYFPRNRVTAENSVPFWVVFETTPLLYNTLFRGWLLDTRGGLPQSLEAGDAGQEISTSSLRIFGSLGEPLSLFDLSSALLTPNGDGNHDTIEISYDLVFLLEEARVDLEIFDLAGRRRLEVFTGGRVAGRYAQVWDGRDSARALVPPGHYLCRLSVNTQAERLEGLRLIAVVY